MSYYPTKNQSKLEPQIFRSIDARKTCSVPKNIIANETKDIVIVENFPESQNIITVPTAEYFSRDFHPLTHSQELREANGGLPLREEIGKQGNKYYQLYFIPRTKTQSGGCIWTIFPNDKVFEEWQFKTQVQKIEQDMINEANPQGTMSEEDFDRLLLDIRSRIDMVFGERSNKYLTWF